MLTSVMASPLQAVQMLQLAMAFHRFHQLDWKRVIPMKSQTVQLKARESLEKTERQILPQKDLQKGRGQPTVQMMVQVSLEKTERQMLS